MSLRTRLHFAVNVILAAAFAVTAGMSANTHAAPEGDYQPMAPGLAWDAFLESRAHHPDNVPDWTRATAAANPGCEATREGVLYGTLVVVDSGNDAARMTLDKAYALNNDREPANDVWVIGGCDQ